jgi:hypothetical protein
MGIGIKGGALAVHRRDLIPQLFSASATAITDMKGEDLTGFGI